MTDDELRRRAAALIKSEKRYRMPPRVRHFLLGLAVGLILSAFVISVAE